MPRKFIIFIFVVSALALAYTLLPFSNPLSILQREKNIPQVDTGVLNQSQETNPENIPLLSTVASNLEIPWALAFLPNGSLMFTERKGNVWLIDTDGNLSNKPVAQINVKTIGESGLHGIAIHPNFNQNQFIYLYYTYEGEGDETRNRVSRFTLENNRLTDETFIVNGIPGAIFHDGGRIKFGPDGFLYIATGDAREPSLSQNTNSLAGKILRVTDNGSPVPDNPFSNLVYSYGHRNPQGLTWDSQGRLWENEHGQSATDELNLIEAGANYGWPTIRGDETQQGLKSPIIHSGSDTWAPSGNAYLNGSIFFVGLRGQALYEAKIENGEATLVEHLKGQLGRMREVVVGPDNMLYITTSNRDGRGIPTSEDDRLIRVNPSKF
ncbi:glucose sorbosone dehydrogenase [Candidatus Curtissbacteria bacterium RIFCSPLOWO2_12_FULL_38_9]|uniref:Glucose sorbosone dehydrogenase n=1 Tax=Candidatus Curtissbacteria bacterium RIFCSPLOWO2_12_FULL_38_9 TaxID=1797735 RepID=A0A1F5ICC5_9BACT|nr:MAG: glucose sorbosone dehydrogenase [Candidatus Curtissbacteria bacterium RIFCSPLOWO2_12_FULL_38_9]